MLLCPWGSPGKNTGGFPSPGIFPTQGPNPHLRHWQEDSVPLSQRGSPDFYWSTVALWAHVSLVNRPYGVHVCCSLVPESCPTLCDPVDCSPPGSSVHGISQAILEWGAISFSRKSSQPRDQVGVSCKWIPYHWAAELNNYSSFSRCFILKNKQKPNVRVCRSYKQLSPTQEAHPSLQPSGSPHGRLQTLAQRTQPRYRMTCHTETELLSSCRQGGQDSNRDVHFLQITSFFSWGIPEMQSHLPESDLLVPWPSTILLEFVGGFGMNAGLSKVPTGRQGWSWCTPRSTCEHELNSATSLTAHPVQSMLQ